MEYLGYDFLPKPLSPPLMYILLALSYDRAHAYEVRRQVLELSKGGLEIPHASCMRHLKDLEAVDFITQEGARTAKSNFGRERRLYYLTSKGENALKADFRRMQRLVKVGLMRELITGDEMSPEIEALFRGQA